MSKTEESPNRSEYSAPEFQTVVIDCSSRILDASTGGGTGDDGEEEEG